MRILQAALITPVILGGIAYALDSAKAVEEAIKVLPPCALQCLVTSVTKSSCKLSDFHCISENVALNKELESCVKKSCTIREALTTKNFSETAYGSPIRDHTHLVSYIAMVPGCIAILAFVLRVYARLPHFGGTWGQDDWAMVATTISALPLTALSVVLANEGLGKDMWTVPFDSITRILQIYYFDELFYIASTALTKISILLFYLRIFPNKKFRRFVLVILAFNVLYIAGFMPAAILQCIPVSLAWKRWDGTHSGKCVNLNTMAWTAAAVNIVLDIIVICLPLRRLSHLKMSRSRKAGIIFMFLGGGFVTIVSIIRLNWMIQFANTENVTWDYTAVGYWSTLEVHVGMIVACLPALRSLQHRLFPSSKTSSSYYNERSPNYGYGTKGGIPFLSLAKFRNKMPKNTTTASQSSIMRSGADKDFVQLDDYGIQLEPDVEAGEVGRGVNNTHIECASVHTGDGTFLDTSSNNGGRVIARPNDAITVKKEYSVNVEYMPNSDGLHAKL